MKEKRAGDYTLFSVQSLHFFSLQTLTQLRKAKGMVPPGAY